MAGKHGAIYTGRVSGLRIPRVAHKVSVQLWCAGALYDAEK